MNYKNKFKINNSAKTYSVVGSFGDHATLDDDCELCRQMKEELQSGKLKKVMSEGGAEVFEVIEN